MVVRCTPELFSKPNLGGLGEGPVRGTSDCPVIVRPVLCVGYAWELLNFGELQAAEVPTDHAERLLESRMDMNGSADGKTAEMVVVNKVEFSSLRASLATARGYYAQALGDASGTIRHARRVMCSLPLAQPLLWLISG